MKRLEAVCSLITRCGLFADIGTDHGRIAAFAADYADRVIATDISEMCLNKAKESIKAANVEFLAGDGLTVLDSDPDIIAICGMGGHTITDILAGYDGGAALILQPQNDAPHLRQFLGKSGYKITDDITACERGKFYDVIRAERGSESLSCEELEFGKFYKEKNPLLKARLCKLRDKLKSFAQTAENQQMLEMVESALIYQQ